LALHGRQLSLKKAALFTGLSASGLANSRLGFHCSLAPELFIANNFSFKNAAHTET